MIALTVCLLAPLGLPLLWAAEIDHIAMDDLKTLIERGEKGFLVVDVQPASVYKAGHIKGAVSFPWQPELRSPGNLPKDKILIIYCDCAHEEDSIDTAAQLKEKWDYTNVKVLQGGWTKWMTLGYPIEK